MTVAKPPARTASAPTIENRSTARDIAAFVAKAKTISSSPGGSGSLILALDATLSRQPTWDMACGIQGEMFEAAGRDGRLGVQLVYFRGFSECRASKFVTDTSDLKRLMAGIDCRGGHTQIGKVLAHALKANAGRKVNALVYIGDAMEEAIDDLAAKAGELGLRKVPVFLFQEGNDSGVEAAYKELARLSGGAWFRFDRNAAALLSKLLATIAVYATGGLKALQARGTAEDRLLIAHLGG